MTKATTTTTTIRTTERLRALLPAFLIWAAACAEPAHAPPVIVARPAAALHRGPLTDYVSAAGLRWLLLVKPQEVLADPELGAAIRELSSDRRFDAFAESSGVDLRNTPHAAIAGFAYSTLYLAEMPSGVAELARQRFGERLLSGAVTSSPHPGVVRTTGVIGQTPETLLTLDDRVLAVAVGDSAQAKIAEAYARSRLKHSPTALRGVALASLPELSTTNAAVLLAPGPFSEEWQSAASGLMQSTVAIALAMQPIGDGKVATTLCLSGAWHDSASDAAQRLSGAWTTFARSSMGRLFSLNEIATVESTPELLTLRVELELSGLLRGLKASVLRDLSQIMDLPRNSPGKATDTAPRTSPSAE